MRKAFIFSLLACLLAGTAFSQGTFRGKLIDSASKQALGLATVTIFKASDTTIITYRLSTAEGDFRIPGLPLDVECRAVISYSGYSIYRKEFTLTGQQPVLDAGTIYMEPDSKSLDEILIISERPPVVIKKDTIEFNASAFRTLPNALVEDLLKKLPGVEVDKDGNISVNGKPVNRILVDGKTFFGDDPKMATRNLPANVIDKVQVVDDKEELLRNGDDNLNNVGKVVNITLKKGVKKGWFGKLYAGGGTNNRYEAGGIANIYRDTLQVSLLGYANNLNKPGFSYNDLMQAGGMARSRSNSNGYNTNMWSNGNGSGLSINGVNFGGSQNYGGISTSKGAGFNLNHSPSSKRSFFLQYFYGNINTDRRVLIRTQQFTSDTAVFNNSEQTGGVVSNAHNIGTGMRLKPDSVTNILINLNYTMGLQDESRFSDISSTNNKLGDLSRGNIYQNNKAETHYYRHSVFLTRLSKTKAGRRFTLGHNLDMNNRYTDYLTESDVHFIYPTAYDSIQAQLRRERLPRLDANLNGNYSEPITKKISLRIGGRYEYGKLTNRINTFYKDPNGKYEVPNALLSSLFTRESNRLMITPGLEFRPFKSLTITPSLRFQWQHVSNDLASMASPLLQKRTDLLPMLGIVYKQINLNYAKDITLPSHTYLLPVTDNTNPYFVTRGNTSLQPAERHTLSASANFNDPKRNLSIYFYGNGSLVNNDVVQRITVDEKGVQTVLPVNANDTRNAFLNFNINKQYKKNQRLTFSWYIGGYYSILKNRFIYNDHESWQSNYSFNNWSGLGLNWNDKVEWNGSYTLGGQLTKNTNTTFKPLSLSNHWLTNELVVRWPKHVIFETQLNYAYNSAVPNGMDKEAVRWNAAVNFTMLKNEVGVLKLSVFDILRRNNSIWVSSARNTMTTIESNILQQYFMATFTYNVRAAGVKKKVGGRESLFQF